MDNIHTRERESLCSLDGGHWKGQQNFEKDKESSEAYSIQRP